MTYRAAMLPWLALASLATAGTCLRLAVHPPAGRGDESGRGPGATGDLFERDDDYFLYLKPQALSDDEVRRRNAWKPGAIVPRWIAMPPH